MNRTQLTTNADRPENGLEGLAQVLLEIVPWTTKIELAIYRNFCGYVGIWSRVPRELWSDR